jgi:hypothetical protein
MSDVAKELSTETAELVSFHEFLSQRLKAGDDKLTPEEAVDIWRSAHPLPEDFEDTVAALREALEDLDAGDVGQPLEEFDAEFRARHNLPPRQ